MFSFIYENRFRRPSHTLRLNQKMVGHSAAQPTTNIGLQPMRVAKNPLTLNRRASDNKGFFTARSVSA